MTSTFPGGTGALAVAGMDLLDELGRGAHAVVYRARREGVEYAVKMGRVDRATNAGAAAAIRREAGLLACVNHPAVARVFEVGESAGSPYLVMEIVEGRSLADVLDDGPMSVPRVVRLATDLAGALTAAHRVGVIHRDVKPENVMVLADGQPKLVDFGLATQQLRADGTETVGTFAYAAPEQTGMLARPVDGRADLYALGAVMFECLAGTRPFNANDVGELVRLHAVAEVPDLSARRGDVPPALAAIVNRLLAKDPDDRYQDGAALATDLGSVHTARSAPAGQVPAGVVSARRPLVGRRSELARLQARWEQARSGTGGAARVSGPAGSGKTRLVDELCATAGAAGYPVLTLTGTGESAPLAHLRVALEGYVAAIRQLPEAQRDAAAHRMRAAAGAGASVLQLVFPVLASALRAAELPEEDRRDQLGAAVVTFLTGLAGLEGGLILRIEEARRLDPGSARVVRQLVSILRQHPILVLTTETQELADDAPSWLTGGRRVGDTTVRLKPMDLTEVAELAATQLGGGAVAERLVAQLTARTGGNPFAVLEYLRAMLDEAVIRPYWGTWVLDEEALDRLALPGNVLDLVVARVDTLPETTRALLTGAAAIGTPFHPELLAAVCQVQLNDAVTAIQDGLATGVLEVRATAYAFLHERVTETLMSTVDDITRRSLHQRIAEALDGIPSDDPAHRYAVARHYRDGEPARTPVAMFHACCAAAQAALSDQAPEEALDYLLMARTAADAGGPALDGDFYRMCGMADMRVGRLVEAQVSLEKAVELEPDALRRGEMLGLIAEAQHGNYASTDSVATVRRGLAAVGSPLWTSWLALTVSTVLLFAAGVFVSLTGRGFGTATGAQRERYRIRAGLYLTGAMGAAVGMQRMLLVAFHLRCLYLVNRLGGGPEYVRLQAGLGLITGVAGWRKRSRRCFERAYAQAHATGDPGLAATVAWAEASGTDGVPGVAATTGDNLRAAVRQHGRWMSLSDYLSAVATVGTILAFRGYAHEAAAWYERGHDRMEAGAAVPGNPIAMLGVMVAAASGQRALTEQRLAVIRELAPMLADNPGQRVGLLIGAALAGAEQNDDETLDAVDREIGHQRLTPRQVWPQQRCLWLYLAWGRLAQCRTASTEDRSDRLARARHAVRMLGRAANTPALKAYHQAALGDYLHLSGADHRALRHLSRADLLGQPLDLPMLACQTATTRARIWRTLGKHAEAARQACYALHLATENGWENRARDLRVEFRTGNGSTGSQQSRSGTGAGHTIVPGSAGRRLAALQQVSIAAATILDPDELARVVLDETIRVFAAERAILFLPGSGDAGRAAGDGTPVPHLGRGADGRDLDELTGYGSTLIEQVRQSGQAIVVTSGEQGAALGSRSVVAHGLRSVMIAPLQLKGELLGLVYLDSRVAKGVFTEDDVDILTAITNHIAAAMLTARAARLATTIEAAERRSELADTMRTFMIEISRTLDPDTVIDRLLATLRDTAGADAGVVIRPDGSCLHSRDGAGLADRELRTLLDTVDTARFASIGAGTAPFAAILPAARSWLAVPLLSREHRVGLLVLVASAEDTFHDDSLRVAAALAEQGMVAYDNALLFSRVEQLATTDVLTDLHNRRHLFQLGEASFADARRRGGPLVAVMLDIDHFKRVNDTHGHGAGDDVIREVAVRLAGVVRDGDLLGRYGGEEFALLLPGASAEAAAGVAERLRVAVAATPTPTRVGPVRVTVSLGTAMLDERDGTVEELLGRADKALYEAKQAGRDRVVKAR